MPKGSRPYSPAAPRNSSGDKASGIRRRSAFGQDHSDHQHEGRRGQIDHGGQSGVVRGGRIGTTDAVVGYRRARRRLVPVRSRWRGRPIGARPIGGQQARRRPGPADLRARSDRGQHDPADRVAPARPARRRPVAAPAGRGTGQRRQAQAPAQAGADAGAGLRPDHPGLPARAWRAGRSVLSRCRPDRRAGRADPAGDARAGPDARPSGQAPSRQAAAAAGVLAGRQAQVAAPPDPGRSPPTGRSSRWPARSSRWR